jgi:hypothetical protein
VFGIPDLGGREPAITLSLQLGLSLLHALVAYRRGFGGIRLDLGALELDMPEPHQPGFSARFHLHEQPGQLFEAPVTKLGDGAEIWRIVSCDRHQVGALGARLGDAPVAIDAAGIAIEQQRIKRWLANRTRIAAGNLGEVGLFAPSPTRCEIS